MKFIILYLIISTVCLCSKINYFKNLLSSTPVEMKFPCSMYKGEEKKHSYYFISEKQLKKASPSPKKETKDCAAPIKRFSQDLKDLKIQHQVLMAKNEGLERDNACLTKQEEYLRAELREAYAEKRAIEAKTREKVACLQTFQKQQIEEKDETLHDYEKRLLNLQKDYRKVNEERFEIYNIRLQEQSDYEKEMKCQGSIIDRLRIEITNLKTLQEMQTLAHQKNAEDQKRREEELEVRIATLQHEKANLQDQLQTALQDRALLAKVSEKKQFQLEKTTDKLREKNDTLFSRNEEHIKEEEYLRKTIDELQHDLTCCRQRLRQHNMQDEKEKLREIDCYKKERDNAHITLQKMEESLNMHVDMLHEAKENIFHIIQQYFLRLSEVMKNAVYETAATVIKKEMYLDESEIKKMMDQCRQDINELYFKRDLELEAIMEGMKENISSLCDNGSRV
ncbi:hypothetical protein SK128_001333 [Halocaridina rubra]|uniref:Uncharacterized protein n=1 Tax=Halocaridina rubra TaxID=373956 RepID=A0AAN9A301_HALRR